MNFPLMEQKLTGAARERMGNRAQSGAPADFFQTQDGWIAVQVIGDPLFRRWAKLIGAAELADDARFASDALRAEHGAILSAHMAAWAAPLSNAAALHALAQARIPAGPVLSPAEVGASASEGLRSFAGHAVSRRRRGRADRVARARSVAHRAATYAACAVG